MNKYVFVYRGGKKFKSPEEGVKHMEKWGAWVNGLGDASVNRGTPFKKSKIVSSDGVSDDGGSNHLTGYSIVKAKSMDVALKMAKACPHLDIGGSIVVAEVMEMKGM